MRRVPAGGEEGIGVHGENRRPPASGAGGSVEAPTVPGARGQSLERRPPPLAARPPLRPHPPSLDRVGRAGKHHTHRDGAISFLITVHYSPGSYRRSGHKGQWTEGEGAHSEQQQGARSDRAQREDGPLRTGLLQGKGRVGRRGRLAAGRTAEFSSGASEGSSAVRDPNAGGKTWGWTHWPCGRRRLPGTAMSSIPKPLRIHPETESGRGNDRRQTARED